MAKKQGDETVDVLDATVGDIAATNVQSAEPSVDWEARFKGLQGSYQTLKSKYDSSTDSVLTLQTELETLKQDSTSTQSKLSQIEEQLNAEKMQAEKLATELEGAKKKNDISKKVLADYPELSKFWAEDLIPVADDVDEQVKIFEKFKSNLTSKVDAEIDEKVKGSSPVVSGSAQKMSADSIYKEMSILAGSNDPKDRARYAVLQDLWDKENNL